MVGREQDLKRPTEKSLMLREALIVSIRSAPADALMLSGGVDSSTLAALDPKVKAYTAALRGEGDDLKFGQLVYEHLKPLGFRWKGIPLEKKEALGYLKTIIKLTGSYDQGLLNDIPLFAAMSSTLESNSRIIRTGHFSDRLFQGYRDTVGIENMDAYLELQRKPRKLIAEHLGETMGLQMNYPYRHPKVIGVARLLRREDNIIEVDTPADFFDVLLEQRGQQAPRKYYDLTKLTLRKVASEFLPFEIAFRMKSDLEFGSGMFRLEEDLAKLGTKEQIAELDRRKMTFRDAAHRGMAILYFEQGMGPRRVSDPSREFKCEWCHGAVTIEPKPQCNTCGAWYGNGHAE